MFASKDIFLTPPSTGGYTIARSVRLRSSASAYFNRTPASATNQKTWTLSLWVKRGILSGALQKIFEAGATSANYLNITWNGTGGGAGSDQLDMYANVSSAMALYFDTTSLYRDPSAWYHVVVAVDTTQATSTNRVKMYVNGAQLTAFASSTYPTQNTNLAVNGNVAHAIGNGAFVNGSYLDGYLTEINFIDGQALTPSSFGTTNAITGVWQPAKYTGTYGTNGFYLNFSDNSSNTSTTIGKDYSGNGNNWTPNNISVTAGATYDSMTDVPTLTSATAANYAVFNPLAKGSIVTISDGNLKYSSNGASGTNGLVSFYITNGMKSYFEFTCGSAALYRNVSVGGMYYAGDSGLIAGGTGGTGTFATWTTNDVIAFACDFTAGTVACYKNNTLQTTVTGVTNTSDWAINAGQAIGLGEYYFNAGQQGFKYTPPTGFVALNTYNLPASTITNGAAYMAATIYTGDGTSTRALTNTVNSTSFQPDLVWIKNRSAGWGHRLSNSVVGANYALESNNTAAELYQNQYGYLASFNSNGFTVQTGSTDDYYTNNSGDAYVAWQWKAGGTSASNTNGSITSTVSVGATQGFSVVTYTGNGTNGATVGHGLGVAPSMIITKMRNAVGTDYGWSTYHVSDGTYNIWLNRTDAKNPGNWPTAPTSTVFTPAVLDYNNVNTATYVNYCWAAVAGYSAFGSYTGNGSADGPFVFTNFRPRWVMIKRTDSANDWFIIDTSRNTYNVAGTALYPNSSSSETSNGFYDLDVVSNGFKVKATNAVTNASGGTYIYAAFAESPFKTSLAR